MARSIYSLSARELAPDIVALIEMHRAGKLHEAVMRQVLKGACWWISNAQGRKDACDLWSKSALEARNSHPSWAGLDLVHEHIVPRNVIEEAIFSMPSPNVADVERLLALSRVCVVTPSEDARLRELGLGRKLPGNVSYADALLHRYEAAGIELAETAFRRVGSESSSS